MSSFRVEEDGIILEARLLEEGDSRKIELIYTNIVGDRHISVLEKGVETSSRASLGNGKSCPRDEKGNTYLSGAYIVYDQLGRKLKEQIPSDWYGDLGDWLN